MRNSFFARFDHEDLFLLISQFEDQLSKNDFLPICCNSFDFYIILWNFILKNAVPYLQSRELGTVLGVQEEQFSFFENWGIFFQIRTHNNPNYSKWENDDI